MQTSVCVAKSVSFSLEHSKWLSEKTCASQDKTANITFKQTVASTFSKW